MVRRCLGWQVDMPEKERASINRKAEKLVKAFEKGDTATEATEAVPFVLAAKHAREVFDAHRKAVEKTMTEAAKSLPIWAKVQHVRGFGPLSLAIIVGETGDLAEYSNPAKLWKQFGLAPKDCYAMTCKNGEQAYAIPRRRRSAMWTIGDCLIKQNDGEYRQLYDTRKAKEHAKGNGDMTKMHAHRRAQRYMEKRLLKNLWRAWQTR